VLWVGVGLLVAVFREADEALYVCSLGEVADDDIVVVDGGRHRHGGVWMGKGRELAILLLDETGRYVGCVGVGPDDRTFTIEGDGPGHHIVDTR
jgi:hypothetical protein